MKGERFKKIEQSLIEMSKGFGDVARPWELKTIALAALFYRYLSEDFVNFIEAGDKTINYPGLSSSQISDDVVGECVYSKGYFISPEDVFSHFLDLHKMTDDIGAELTNVLMRIENSSEGYPSESTFKDIFSLVNTRTPCLGSTNEKRNSVLLSMLNNIAEIDFGEFKEDKNEAFGHAFNFLIAMYSEMNVTGGELHTRDSAVDLMVKIASFGKESVNKVYDPVVKDGLSLLKVRGCLTESVVEKRFFGQALNTLSHNIARMNLIANGVGYSDFSIIKADPLTQPCFTDQDKCDVVISNPPYSKNWVGSDDPKIANDERFTIAGSIAPKSKADFAYVMHALSYLSDQGCAVVVTQYGALMRGGPEKNIRQYMVDKNFVEGVIALPAYSAGYPGLHVNLLVLSKSKIGNEIFIVDARKMGVKTNSGNVLSEENVSAIFKVFSEKREVANFSRKVSANTVAENGYNLNVDQYIGPRQEAEASFSL